MDELARVDPEIASVVADETRRQQEGLELIASENFTSRAVLAAMGSVLTNKYAEGYPGKRYYGGCEVVDRAETLARERAKALFGAEHANVQPHSGTQANMAVYFACLKPGDTILSMNLSAGGHLSHGSPVSFSGRLYNVVYYGVRWSDCLIDVDEVRRLALEHRPGVIVCGYSAYPRAIPFADFRAIADESGALLLADIAHVAGLVASGVHESPVGVAHFTTSTTHKTLRGPRGGLILCDAERAREVDRAVFPRTQGGPLMHVIAAKAVAFAEASTPEFKAYSRAVVENARALAETLLAEGFTLVTGGTDNHLMLLDLRREGMTGARAEDLLGLVGITVNKNSVPFETEKPTVTSGIRIGVPALTTRGMGASEMEEVGRVIARVLASDGDEAVLAEARGRVADLAAAFPLYEEVSGARDAT